MCNYYNTLGVFQDRLPKQTVHEKTGKILDREAVKFIQNNPEYVNYKISNIDKRNLLTYMVYDVEFIRKDKDLQLK